MQLMHSEGRKAGWEEYLHSLHGRQQDNGHAQPPSTPPRLDTNALGEALKSWSSGLGAQV